ncbi:hypothetical protein HanXRQr2_Chr06g0265051 [Helianthus annuus]|uniref:Uncharacterized protein n=1 Tax=Helianthus annuus TaxID=4232 RepID=A0A251UJ84_HELAN|nr:hypothetical protein HanXRQr2_Chr06g0265051 [Helianthus annuus]
MFATFHVLYAFFCRMLLAFTDQIKGQKLPPNASDQEMLEIVMDRSSCQPICIIVATVSLYNEADDEVMIND